MRNLRRDRNRALALLLGSTSAGVLMVLERPSGGGFRWEDVGVGIAACVALLSVPLVLTVGLLHARYRRTLRGDRLLARWTVSPSEWKQFMEAEASRDSDLTVNSIAVRPESLLAGVPIVIGAKGLIVDDDYNEFAKGRNEHFYGPRLLNGQPARLEWQFEVSGEEGSSHWTVRIPIPSGAEADANRVVEHFASLDRTRKMAHPPNQ